MRINFHKCDLVPININGDDANIFAQILGCKLGESPIKYLPAPLHHRKLKKNELQPAVDKIIKKGLDGEVDCSPLARGLP